MSFAKKDQKRFDAHDRSAQRFVLPRRPPFPWVRALGLAVIVTLAAAWAIAYHFSLVHAPMLVPGRPPAPPPSATYDADAGELPVPELDPQAP